MCSSRSPRTPGRGLVNRRPQMATSCVVVERPEHHCGDDLVEPDRRTDRWLARKNSRNSVQLRFALKNRNPKKAPLVCTTAHRFYHRLQNCIMLHRFLSTSQSPQHGLPLLFETVVIGNSRCRRTIGDFRFRHVGGKVISFGCSRRH